MTLDRSPALATTACDPAQVEPASAKLEAATDDALRFEQRTTDRWPVEGVATVFHLAGDRFGQMHTLKMLDYSHDGLGAICDEPVEPGTLISIGFQSPGYVAKRGVVASCRPCGEGYRVGISFEARMAA